MDRRKAGVEATRHRIVLAAARLHGRQGSQRTTWDEIAEEARVSRATVYHHFPSSAELVPACAQLAFDLAAVPSRAEATARFAALPTPADRMRQFIGETCRCYSAGAFWLRAAWRERDLVPEMGAAVRRLQRGLRVLLDAALDGVPMTPESRPLLLSLLDFPFWDALRSAGVPDELISKRLTFLVDAVLRDGGDMR